MSVEYFSWSAIDVTSLGEMIFEVVRARKSDFREETSDLHDTDERFATRAFLDSLRDMVSSWCDHFEVPFDSVKGYDRMCYALGAPAGPMSWSVGKADFDTVVNRLVVGITSSSTDSAGLYRPKVFETANIEVMKWLRSRPEYVDRVDPRSFEAIVAEVVQDRGWRVELTKQTRDGGYDILAIGVDAGGLSIRLLVECKLYNVSRAVGLPMIDRLMGVVSREKADGGVVVTNSRFTNSAWQAWESRVGRDLQLIDRAELFHWLNEYRMT